MTDEQLTQIVKKLDRILSQQTKIMKALHLLPVTEKEERAIQLQQRSNLANAAKVSEDLSKMANEPNPDDDALSLGTLYTQPKDVYGDVLADDFLGGFDK
jgi:hypothetical protein